MQLGVIFDWDGTLIDSSEHHAHSWEQLAKEAGYAFSQEAHLRAAGSKNDRVISQVFRWTEDPKEIESLGLRKEELYREILKKRPVRLIPGAQELLEELAKYSIPTAIGSSTPRKNIEAVFESTPLQHYFKTIITGDEVKHGKPNPEVFLKAARSLNCPPAFCVVFEDAPVGIDAALAGGMKAIALATTHPPQQLENAHLILPNLTKINFSQLDKLFRY